MSGNQGFNVEQGKQGFQPTVPRPASPPAPNEIGSAGQAVEELALFDLDDSNAKASIVERELLKKQMEPHGKVILSGVVGSTAYGLAHKDSDRDRLGMFIAPTEQLLVLDNRLGTRFGPPNSVVFHEPSDAQFHEVGRYVELALACNPTATELMWLNEYETEDSVASRLMRLREDCLSAPKVRDAYLGYAGQQLERIMKKEPEEDGGMNERRMRKHALHMARIVRQGHELYTTGQLTVRVSDPGWYREFQKGTKEQWSAWFEGAAAKFEGATTVLPEEPYRARLGAWLLDVRYSNLPDHILPPF